MKCPDDFFFEAWLYPITFVSRLKMPLLAKILCVPIGAVYILATLAPVSVVFIVGMLIWAAID